MQSILYGTLTVAVLLIVNYPKTEAWRLDVNCPCIRVDPEDCNFGANCEYGDYIDKCGIKVCKKGPDEKCGGQRRGVCGDGLKCSNCGKCEGCSSIGVMKCSQDQCPYLTPQ